MGPGGNGELSLLLERPATSTLTRAGVVALLAGVALGVLALPVRLCLVAALFHVPCPGCGLTRATLAMAQGDVARAFELHPMSIVLVPLVGFVVAAHAVRYVRTGNAWTERRLNAVSEAIFATMALLLLAVWVARLYGWFGGPVPI